MTRIYRTLAELDGIVGDINGHFLYRSKIASQVTRAVNQTALSHSSQLEIDSSSDTSRRKLLGAWDLACEEYNGTLDHGLVTRIGHEIDGRNFGYRRINAQFLLGNGEISVMTNPAKIDREMGKVYDHVGSDLAQHPALTAAELHLYTFITHPLEDGNKRLSRLLTNLHLEHRGLPPALIKRSERATYLDRLEAALVAFKGRGGQEEMFYNRSPEELAFFQYVVERVLETADELRDNIVNLRRYEVDLKTKGKSGRLERRVASARRFLRDNLKAHGSPYETMANNNDTGFTVITDAPLQCVQGAMYQFSQTGRKSKGWLKGFDVKDTT